MALTGASSHLHGADAGHRVVAMGERYDRAEPAGVNRWSLNRMLQWHRYPMDQRESGWGFDRGG
jgi:hypothetical protein